jgi:UDP-glucose 4-epimerase
VILVTGGLGFIGSHTVRALLDLGETCVVTQHRRTEVPTFLAADVGGRAKLVSLDVRQRGPFMALRDEHVIDGIVHFTASLSNPFNEMRDNVGALANVLEAASTWKVERVCVASTIGVYGGATTPGEAAPEDAAGSLWGGLRCPPRRRLRPVPRRRHRARHRDGIRDYVAWLRAGNAF